MILLTGGAGYIGLHTAAVLIAAGHPVVLAHAVIVVDADPLALTEAANAFERDLGSGRRYRAEVLTSVALAWRQTHGSAPPQDLQARVSTAITDRLARASAPRETTT